MKIHQLPANESIASLHSTPQGLLPVEAIRRLHEYDPNRVQKVTRQSTRWCRKSQLNLSVSDSGEGGGGLESFTFVSWVAPIGKTPGKHLTFTEIKYQVILIWTSLFVEVSSNRDGHISVYCKVAYFCHGSKSLVVFVKYRSFSIVGSPLNTKTFLLFLNKISCISRIY